MQKEPWEEHMLNLVSHGMLPAARGGECFCTRILQKRSGWNGLGSTAQGRTNVIQRAALLGVDQVGVAPAPPLVVQVYQRQLACPVLEHNLQSGRQFACL